MMQRFEIMKDDKLVENELPRKSHKKLKIAIAVVTSAAIIATTVLLVGYFKLNWFQSEIYNVDATISRKVYQADYFSETKTIKTTATLGSGNTQEKELSIKTNFMVMQTDRKEINHAIVNFASLVVLKTIFDYDNQEKELNSFNIFDSSILDEVKANPDGSKFPMSQFSFFDNGTIHDIKLPANIDLQNAHSILDLIEGIVPKLTRNRTEDNQNGLNIKTREDKKKKTLIEIQEPKELPDFRKSKYQKTIERDIEDGQITNIRSKSNLVLTNQKEEDEETFGIQDFFYDQYSDISLTKTESGPFFGQVSEDIGSFFLFESSTDYFRKQERKETNENVVDEWEEDLSSPDSTLRQLGFSISGSKTVTLKTLSVLGKSISIQLKVGVSSGKAYCKLVIGGVNFGKDGITAEYSKSFGTGTLTIFYFAFPAMPAISVSVTAKGTLTLSIKFASSAKTKLNFSLSGSLVADAFVRAGWDAVASVSAGASGTLVSASISAGVSSSGVTYSKSLSGGKIVAYIKGKALGFTVFYHEKVLFNGWSC